jgi:chromosome partitioning protein
MIICLAGTKGGSGRSTTTTNFACIAAGQGMKVFMVDADDQETSADFTAARKQDHPDAPSFTCIKLTARHYEPARGIISQRRAIDSVCPAELRYLDSE